MNVSSTDLSSSLAALLANQSSSTSQTQSSSLASLLDGSTSTTDSTDTSSIYDSASSNSQLLSSGVQNAASFIQAGQSALSGISDVLAQMATLAKDAASTSTSATQKADDQKQFDALRDQLRSAIGGSTAEIGGTAAVTGSDSLNGQPLFGANASSFTIGTGLTSAPTMNVNGVNLRQGPMQALLSQDSSGSYTMSADAASASIAGAQQQVQAGASTLTQSDSVLSATLASLQIQSSNLVSALDSAASDSALAQYSILGSSSTALSSQGNLNASNVMNLLESA